MAGKRDRTAHEAAVAKLTQLSPYAKEVRAHLEAVLQSRAFQSSRRTKDFLRFVVDRALEGKYELLKERCIGADLFGRKADYDTSDDSIVRVTATDVRKRLLQYYLELETLTDFRIELPPGSYVPDIERISHKLQEELAADSVETPLPETQRDELNGERSFIPPPRVTSTGFVKRNAARMALFLAGCAFGCLLLSLLRAEQAEKAPSPIPKNLTLYRDLLGPMALDAHMGTQIVLSNPRVFIYGGGQNKLAAQPSNSETIPLGGNAEQALNGGADENIVSQPFHFLRSVPEDYTGMGEALAAISVNSILHQMGRKAQVTQARFLNWDIVQKQHLVLLGLTRMNPLICDAMSSANFVMEHTEIVNTRPEAGEQTSYKRAVSGNVVEDYGLIWMNQLPSGARVLLIAGLTSVGTAGAGNFFGDPDKMNPVYRKMQQAVHGGAIPASWQLLLRIASRDSLPVDVSLVTMRLRRVDNSAREVVSTETVRQQIGPGERPVTTRVERALHRASAILP